jgi:hypothetical protein
MDAENARNAGGQRVAHGVHGFRHPLAGVGDEGGQQAGGAVGAMGGRKGSQAVHVANIVEENAAAAIDLDVDEARSEQPLDPAALHIRAEIPLLRDGEDAAVPDHHGAAFEDVRAVEDARSGQR